MEEEEIASNVVPAMLACIISGLSTGVGGVMILFYGKPSNAKIGHMLSFSTGVMLYISFMDLLYESIIRLGFFTANLWFFAGMVFFAAVLKFFPEPEIIDKKAKAKTDNGKPDKYGTPSKEYLIHLGIVTAVGISLHNFPEGLAVYVACLKGLAVAAPIYEATGSKWQALKYSVLSGICEPVGALVFGVFFSNLLTPYIVQCLLAGVAGIMVFMCIRELMPATVKYIKASSAAYSNIVGMFIMFLSVYYLHGMLPHSHTPLYDTGASTTAGSTASHAHDATCAHDH